MFKTFRTAVKERRPITRALSVLVGIGLIASLATAYAYREPIFRHGFDAGGLLIRPTYIWSLLNARLDYWRSPVSRATGPRLPALHQYQYVAHGLGEIGGRQVTNSKEAFINSYAEGIRLFEIDFIYSIGGQLIASHDRRIATHKAFMANNPGGDQRLDLAAFKQLLAAYPEAFVITDFKQNFYAMLRDFLSSFSDEEKDLLRQVIFQIYSEFDHHVITTGFPSLSFVYTNYIQELEPLELLSFLKATGQTVVVVPVGTITPSFVECFHREGIRLFVHTVNLAENIQALKEIGVDGFYVDRVRGL